jgi:hypothetical protein
VRARLLDGAVHLARRAQVDLHAPALFATGRFHDDAAMAVQEGGHLGVGAHQGLLGQAQPGGIEHLARHALVVAAAHRHRRGEVGERLAAAHGAPAMREAEEAVLGVLQFHTDAAAARLVDEDARIDVDLGAVVRPGEELLVDRVLVLDAVHRHPLEAQLLVQRDGVLVVVHHRQVEVAPAL